MFRYISLVLGAAGILAAQPYYSSSTARKIQPSATDPIGAACSAGDARTYGGTLYVCSSGGVYVASGVVPVDYDPTGLPCVAYVVSYAGGLYPCAGGVHVALAAPSASGVETFAGRTGAVVPADGDYTADEITAGMKFTTGASSTPPATCTRGKEFYLDTTNWRAHFCAATDTFVPLIKFRTSELNPVNPTECNEAIELGSMFADFDAVTGTTSLKICTQNDAGSYAWMNIVTQTQLATKVATTRAITAGTGLSGGGDLSSDRSISLANTAVTPGDYTAADITVDQQGRITAAASGIGGLTSVQNGSIFRAVSSTESDTWTATMSPAPASYTTGMVVHLKVSTANTDAATLNLNALGAVTVKRADCSTDLTTNDIKAASQYALWHNGTYFCLMGKTDSDIAEDIADQATAMIGRTVEIAVAKRQATAAASGFNLPVEGGSPDAPAASLDSDNKPILTFEVSDTTDPDSFIMPASVSSIDATLMMRASADTGTLSGNAVWRISYVCSAIDGTASSVPTLSNTVDSTVTITSTAANLAYPATFSIPPTGCAGKRFHWKLSLVSRTLAADPQAIDTFHVRVQ